MTVPVIVAYTWLLTAGTWDLFQRQYFDNFFDAQARSMLDGRLDVPPEVVGFEGFLIGGKTYIYFGPVPALLRMPVMLVTDRFDGRLTTVSMLVAMLVLSMAALPADLRDPRPFVRGADPVGRREPLATAGLAVAVLVRPAVLPGVRGGRLQRGARLGPGADAAVVRRRRSDGRCGPPAGGSWAPSPWSRPPS